MYPLNQPSVENNVTMSVSSYRIPYNEHNVMELYVKSGGQNLTDLDFDVSTFKFKQTSDQTVRLDEGFKIYKDSGSSTGWMIDFYTGYATGSVDVVLTLFAGGIQYKTAKIPVKLKGTPIQWYSPIDSTITNGVYNIPTTASVQYFGFRRQKVKNQAAVLMTVKLTMLRDRCC